MTDLAEPSAEDWRARAELAERTLTDAVQAAEQRLIRAELKAEGLRAGMVDLDGIKLVDTNALTLNEHGEVAGAPLLMANLKRAKPWLFGGHSTSTGAKPPNAQPPQQRLATEMSDAEWRAARADLVKRR